MPRARSPNREKARQMYIDSNGTKKLIDIAAELGIKDSQVRKWKSQDKWEADLKGALPNKKRSVTKRRGGQPGNKNATGPPRNKNAEKFGFFSKYLPEETKEIFDAIDDADTIDLLWHQIKLSYTAIMNAQRIMYVTGKDEMIKEVKRIKTRREKSKLKNSEEKEIEFAFQFAWDRQASFLTAQARAMAELRSLIRQYEDNATEEQMARIAKIKADTTRIQKEAAGKTNDSVDDWLSNVMEDDSEGGEE